MKEANDPPSAAGSSAGEERDAFYVGYFDRAPRPLARWLRPRLLVLVAGGLTLGALLAIAQRTIVPARFEFGSPRSLAGTLAGGAYPVLWASPIAPTPGAADAPVPYLLVGPGKHGAASALGDLAGAADRSVALRGTLAVREGSAVLEVEPGSLQVLSSVANGDVGAPPAVESLGRVTLRGEIVDGKCFLGVMNPGEGKVHRGCAVRCIAGGTPPLLVVRDGTGAWRSVLLVGPEGESIASAILDRVAEPVEVAGELERRGALLVLRARPADVHRLD